MKKITGTINEVGHTPGSGIVSITVLDVHGDIVKFHADAGPFFRSPLSRSPLGHVWEFKVNDLNVLQEAR